MNYQKIPINGYKQIVSKIILLLFFVCLVSFAKL